MSARMTTLRRIPAVLASIIFLAQPAAISRSAAQPQPAANGVPALNHIIVIVMENKSYDEVRTAPYTASLIASGNTLTSSFAITHPSQPNYIALWSGATQGVVNDACPAPGTPMTAENLGHVCETAGISWRSYAEDLPSVGWNGCSSSGGLYHRRHCPWTNFSNLDHLNERPYTDLAADIAQGTLPRLAFVIPNNCDNTHDCTIQTGDDWLAANVPAMLQAVGPQGVVILTWDEDDNTAGNHILTVFAGEAVIPGHVTTRYATHYAVLRTICDALGIAPFGLAAFDTPITEGWADAASGVATHAGAGPILGPAFPNPSTGAFEARLSAAAGGQNVDAGVYDAGGRCVARLLTGSAARDGVIRWNGREDDGSPAAGGVYYLRLQTGGKVLGRRLIVVR